MTLTVGKKYAGLGASAAVMNFWDNFSPHMRATATNIRNERSDLLGLTIAGN